MKKCFKETLLISVILMIMLIPVSCAPIQSETTPPPVISETPVISQTAAPTVEPSVQPDVSILTEDLNIMLIGVDYAPERDSWSGKHMYHSDVMMVLHINAETNKVNIISLPGNTYSNIPGVKGIYKLSSSLNCGGEWPSQSACEKVCEAASWTLGGIPIKYYYAVDIAAAKDIVNQINGIDFDVDVTFSINGRSYIKGFQHMDGQAVLDYLRVKRIDNDSLGDTENSAGNTEQRQQKMMLAIFQSLKDSGKISDLPAVINDFKSNHLVTNTSLAQTAALAACLNGINGEDIRFHTIAGKSITLGNLTYFIMNQEKRIQKIQEIYGIDITDQDAVKKAGIIVPSYTDYSYESVVQRWEEMQIYVVTKQSRSMLDKIKAILDADAYSKYLKGGNEWKLYSKCEKEYEKLAAWDTSKTTTSDYMYYKDFLSGTENDIKSLCEMFSIVIEDDYWEVIYNPYFGEINQPYVQNDIAVDPR